VLAGFDTVSIGEPSARLEDPSSGPSTTAQGWGVSVIESGEFQMIVTNLDGVIWGGGGLIGCANPKTLSVDATAQGSEFTDLVTVGGHTYGIWPPDPNNPNNAADIVRFTPPAACRAIARE
jgi:hypothetical protein